MTAIDTQAVVEILRDVIDTYGDDMPGDLREDIEFGINLMHREERLQDRAAELLERIKKEYETIAFAPLGGDIKASDKIRALDQFYDILKAEGKQDREDRTPVVNIRTEYV